MKSFFKGIGIGLGIGFLILAIGFSGFFIFQYFEAKTEQALSENIPDAADSPPPEEFPESSAEPENPTPPSEEPDIPEEEPQTEALLAFAGDVMFNDHFLTLYDRSGIQALADEEMLSHMKEADLFMLNQEFAFSRRGEPWPDKQYTFRTDPSYVAIFKDLGTDIVTVANNHSLDFGKDAFTDTLNTLAEAEIPAAGGGTNIQEASAPVIRTIGGQTFAFFAATRVSPAYEWYATDSQPGIFQTYDPAKLNAAIAEAESTCDHTIVFVHWGIERNETPEEYQRQLAHGYIEAGADLVVGCHPHVLQGFEYYQGVPIIYSLGNYLFDSRSGDTLLLETTFSAEGLQKVQLVPCRRNGDRLEKIPDPAALYDHLQALSFDVNISGEGLLSP